jgi:hypothetical protein
MKPETIAALFHARRRTDGEQWRTLANKLLSHPAPVPQKALDAWLAAVPNSDSAWAIKAALMIDAALPGVAVGASMLTVDHMDLEQTERTELMWTGPRNGRRNFFSVKVAGDFSEGGWLCGFRFFGLGEGEVGFASFPGFGDFSEDARDESQE